MDSRRHLRRRACEGKRRFADMNAALAARIYPELRAYRCPHCRRWHLGHQPGEVKDRTIGLMK